MRENPIPVSSVNPEQIVHPIVLSRQYTSTKYLFILRAVYWQLLLSGSVWGLVYRLLKESWGEAGLNRKWNDMWVSPHTVTHIHVTGSICNPGILRILFEIIWSNFIHSFKPITLFVFIGFCSFTIYWTLVLLLTGNISPLYNLQIEHCIWVYLQEKYTNSIVLLLFYNMLGT